MRKLITLIYVLLFLTTTPLMASNFNFLTVCIKNNCFYSRVADNPRSRTKGLMNELSMPKNEGVLFVFPFEMKPSFWMKNMKFPLDILFINDDDVIVYIVKNAPPCKQKKCQSFQTTRPASKVLEINAGLCKELNIHVGEKVSYFIEE